MSSDTASQWYKWYSSLQVDIEEFLKNYSNLQMFVFMRKNHEYIKEKRFLESIILLWVTFNKLRMVEKWELYMESIKFEKCQNVEKCVEKGEKIYKKMRKCTNCW